MQRREKYADLGKVGRCVFSQVPSIIALVCEKIAQYSLIQSREKIAQYKVLFSHMNIRNVIWKIRWKFFVWGLLFFFSHSAETKH